MYPLCVSTTPVLIKLYRRANMCACLAELRSVSVETLEAGWHLQPSIMFENFPFSMLMVRSRNNMGVAACFHWGHREEGGKERGEAGEREGGWKGRSGEQNVEGNRKEASQRDQNIPYKVGVVNTTQSGSGWLGVAKCWPGPLNMISAIIQCRSALLLCTDVTVGRVAGLPVLWFEIG